MAERSQKRRDDGTHEPDVATRSQKRRDDGTHEPNLAERSQQRREDGTHEPDVASRSGKRREDGTHEPNVSVRSGKRRAEGTHESRDQAARSQKRRETGVHENMELRDMRRKASPTDGVEEIDAEVEMQNLCYGSGVAYIPSVVGESEWARDQRHDRMRLLARRTGRGPNWRDDAPLEDRASALGITLKEPLRGKEASTMRANRKTLTAKEEAYLSTRPVLPPRPSAPPPDTPEAMRYAAERTLAFGRKTGGVRDRNLRRLRGNAPQREI